MGYSRQSETRTYGGGELLCPAVRQYDAYNEAFRLYGQVASKFSELDESYDLDALAALQDKKPEGYKLLHCDTDLDGDVREAKALKRSFDRLSVEYRKALTPVRK